MVHFLNNIIQNSEQYSDDRCYGFKIHNNILMIAVTASGADMFFEGGRIYSALLQVTKRYTSSASFIFFFQYGSMRRIFSNTDHAPTGESFTVNGSHRRVFHCALNIRSKFTELVSHIDGV